MRLCNSIRYGCDPIKDFHSITQVGEKLDIATMLNRAQLGVLDLNDFRVPRMSEVDGSSVVDPGTDTRLDALLQAPSTSDRLFGQSVEDAKSDVSRLRSMVKKVEKSSPASSPASTPSTSAPPASEVQPS